MPGADDESPLLIEIESTEADYEQI